MGDAEKARKQGGEGEEEEKEERKGTVEGYGLATNSLWDDGMFDRIRTTGLEERARGKQNNAPCNIHKMKKYFILFYFIFYFLFFFF